MAIFFLLLLFQKILAIFFCFYYSTFCWPNLGSPEVDFLTFSRFCLKNTPKKFRLRRADGPGFYYSKKSWQNFLLLLLFQKFSRIFSSALIIVLLRGGSYYYMPGSTSGSTRTCPAGKAANNTIPKSKHVFGWVDDSVPVLSVTFR